MSRGKYKIEHVEVQQSQADGITKDPKEAKALMVFKSRVKKLGYDDHYLMKWLKARNFDVDEAEKMLKKSIAFKDKMRVSKLEKEYEVPEVLQKYLPGGFCGYDKEGSPVLIQLYGYTDMKGILHSVKKSDIEKTKLLEGEQVMKMLELQTKKHGKFINGMTVIIDMENVGKSMLWGPGLNMYAHMGSVMQDNYPEIVKKTFIVNDDYQNELLKYIDASELPAFLGGNLKDSDGNPRCPSKICQGGIVPEHYYLNDTTRSEKMETGSVTSGGKLEYKFDIKTPGSVLRWEFITEGYDVGFGLFFESPSGQETVLEVERVNSHMVPEDGAYTCDKPGTYTVVFDNSHSWARAKSIHYNIDIVEPDTTIEEDLDTVTQGGSWKQVTEDNEVVTKM